VGLYRPQQFFPLYTPEPFPFRKSHHFSVGCYDPQSIGQEMHHLCA
jgi:hypothetical protein